MDTTALLVGLLSSIGVQLVKRENGGGLENTLMAGGGTWVGVWLAGLLGVNPDMWTTLLSTYAFHGIAGSTQPMQALKLGFLDKLFASIGGAVNAMGSQK